MVALIKIVSCPLLVLVAGFGLRAQPAVAERRKVEGISSGKFIEFAPTISADGKTMIFESNKNAKKYEEKWELFESRKREDGTWSESVPLTAINTKCNFLAGPSLTYDGNRIYFTAFIDGITTSEDIFYSDRIGETEWSEPKNIGPPINTDEYEGFPSISADGNSLYYIGGNDLNPVDKKSKETCFVIHVSKKQKNGTWGPPEKLPSQINSGCVRDPRIMADNHTLIYSAITDSGKGKYDLFQTRKNADGSWAEPRSLDFINSEENDQSPTISAAGDTIYYYSDNDIYAKAVPMEYRQLINVTVQGIVHSDKGAAPLSATILVVNLSSGEIVSTVNNPNDGRYSLVLSAGSNFRVEFVNDTHLKEIRNFDLQKQETYKEIDLDISLKSEYRALITTTDRDLKKAVTTWLKVTDTADGNLWSDSLVAGKPLNLNLATGNHTITAIAARYPMVKIAVPFDAKTFKPDTSFNLLMIHEKVRFITYVMDVSSNKRVKTKVTFNNGNQDEVIIADAGESIYLRKGDRYQVVTSSDQGYFFSTTTLVAGEGDVDADGMFHLTLPLTPILVGATLTLNDINFESNSADLKASSFVELDRVIDLMHHNPTVVIEIAAHTDDVGTDEYNFELSDRRAKSVVGYFSRKGVSKKQFVAKGYGKKQPLMSDDTEEARAANRRVELIILKLK